MAFVLWFLLFAVAGHGAYRAICGGFERPQSERLGIYGIVGCLVLLMAAAAMVTKLFG